MKFQWVLFAFFLILTACQNAYNKPQQQQEVIVLNHLDLYPQYPNCPDYFEKDKQLACLMNKFSALLAYNLNKNYQKDFEKIQDTIWLKFQIDSLGQTRFINLIHYNNNIKDSVYKIIFHKIALQFPKIKPAVYHDKPINFEFKIPVVKKEFDSLK